jgi:hypothetical protein
VEKKPEEQGNAGDHGKEDIQSGAFQNYVTNFTAGSDSNVECRLGETHDLSVGSLLCDLSCDGLLDDLLPADEIDADAVKKSHLVHVEGLSLRVEGCGSSVCTDGESVCVEPLGGQSACGLVEGGEGNVQGRRVAFYLIYHIQSIVGTSRNTARTVWV